MPDKPHSLRTAVGRTAFLLERIAAAVGSETVRVSDHGVRHAYLRERLSAEEGIDADLSAPWS